MRRFAESTVDTMPARATGIVEFGDPVGRCRGHVYVACILWALICDHVLGKDMAWDALNCRRYRGFSALNNR